MSIMAFLIPDLHLDESDEDAAYVVFGLLAYPDDSSGFILIFKTLPNPITEFNMEDCRFLYFQNILHLTGF